MLLGVSLFDVAGTTARRQLGTASQVRWIDELDGPGSFQFTLPYEDATGLAVGSVVKFALGDRSDDWVFAGTVEDVKVEKTGEQTGGVARTVQVTGRGLRARLEDAVVYPTGTEQTREFTSQTPGAIFKTLFDEAQARGALSGFTLGFSTTLDSESAPFATTLTLDVSVGDTLSDVADQHQELAVDVWVTPDRVVNYANSRGTDRSGGTNPVILRAGQSVAQILADQKGPITNTVLVGYGADGNTFLTRQNAGSAATYGRREAFLSLANTSDTAIITLSSTKLLDATSAPSDSRTVELADNGPRPYLEFGLGDTVKLADIDGAQQSFRVRSITVNEDDSGRVSFVPELGTARADLDRRLARALAKIERGDLSGESLVATPPSTGGGGGAQPLVTGTVTSYVTLSKSGVVDLAAGGTSSFLNGTGFELAVGDEVVLTEVEGVGGLVVIGWVDRAGGYDPIVFPTPLSVTGFPFDLRNYPYPVWVQRSVPTSPANTLGTTAPTTPVEYAPSGGLGSTGRKLVIQSNTGPVIHNLDTNASAFVTAVGAQRQFTVMGDLIVAVTGSSESASSVIAWNAATGVTTTFNINFGLIGGVSDGRVWVFGRDSVSSAARLFSIDSTATLSTSPQISTWTLSSGFSSMFCRAGNGYVTAVLDGNAVVASTSAPAASATFSATIANTGISTASINAAFSGTTYPQATTYSDTDSTGALYYLMRTGTPATWGFRKLNPVSKAITGFSNVWSTTGNTEDGEPSWINSLTVINPGVVAMGGAVRVDALGLPLDAYVEYTGAAPTASADVRGAALLGSTRFLSVHSDSTTARYLEIRSARGEQLFSRTLTATSGGVPGRMPMLEQADGKIVVAAGATWAGATGGTLSGTASIMRLNTDLTTDATFTQLAATSINALGLQADGKIVIGGTFTTVGATSRTRLARLNSDGTLDTGYAPTADGQVRSLVIQADGKAVIAGDFSVVNGTGRAKIARLNSDGTLDTGFPGEVAGSVNKILRLPSGKLVIVGAFTQVGLTPRANVALLNTDGTLDTSLTADTNGEVYDVAVQADGALILAGAFTTVNGTNRSYLARVSAAGTLDTTFDPSVSAPIWHTLVTSAGDIWFGGRSSAGTLLVDGVRRVLQRGLLRTDGTHKCTEYLPVTAVTDGLTTTKLPMTWLKDKVVYATAAVRKMGPGEYAIIATSNDHSGTGAVTGPWPAWADGVNLN